MGTPHYSFYERFLNVFSPKVAKRRFVSRVKATLEGYTASTVDKRGLMDWYPPNYSANNEITKGENTLLVSRAYDSYRNNEMARSVVNRATNGIVGTGLRPIPDINGELLGLSEDQVDELEEAVGREYQIVARTCDAEGQLNLAQKQEVVVKTKLIAGDIFANVFYRKNPGDIYSIKIQEIDPSRISNPHGMPDSKTMRRGVEIDSYGYPIAYHVLRAHPSDTSISGGDSYIWDRINPFSLNGRKKFSHVFIKDRAGQYRGISYIAPILESLKQLKRYNEAELMAAVLNAFIVFFAENESEMTDSPLPTIEDDERDPKKEDTVEIRPGAFINLLPGQSIKPFTPSRPTSVFDSFVDSFARSISAASDLPKEEVLLQFNNSYSAARAAMLRAFTFYKIRRIPLVMHYCEFFYSNWFDEAVALNRLPHIKGYGDPMRRMAYQNCTWIGDARGAVDEVNEINAAKLRIEIGASSIPVEAQQSSGMSIREIARQNRKAKRILGFGTEEIRASKSITITEDKSKKEDQNEQD